MRCQNNGGRPWGTRTMGQTMGYQNNGAEHGIPEQWGRPWDTRTMGQIMGYQNYGADHGVPEQWGRPWGTRTMGADHGLFEGSIMFCSNKLLISSLKTSCVV